jgi:hypothetical protein
VCFARATGGEPLQGVSRHLAVSRLIMGWDWETRMQAAPENYPARRFGPPPFDRANGADKRWVVPGSRLFRTRFGQASHKANTARSWVRAKAAPLQSRRITHIPLAPGSFT